MVWMDQFVHNQEQLHKLFVELAKIGAMGLFVRLYREWTVKQLPFGPERRSLLEAHEILLMAGNKEAADLVWSLDTKLIHFNGREKELREMMLPLSVAARNNDIKEYIKLSPLFRDSNYKFHIYGFIKSVSYATDYMFIVTALQLFNEMVPWYLLAGEIGTIVRRLYELDKIELGSMLDPEKHYNHTLYRSSRPDIETMLTDDQNCCLFQSDHILWSEVAFIGNWELLQKFTKEAVHYIRCEEERSVYIDLILRSYQCRPTDEFHLLVKQHITLDELSKHQYMFQPYQNAGYDWLYHLFQQQRAK